MSVFWVLLGIAVLCGVAVVAAGRGDGLSPADRDRPDLALPDDRLLVREDVDRLRFSVGLRGYRMDEVDDVLDRLAADIAARDAHIVELQGGAAPEYASQAWTTPGAEGAAEPATASESEPESEPEAELEPAQSAALVPPVDTEPDLPTSRTLLVPLDPYVADEPEDAAGAARDA